MKYLALGILAIVVSKKVYFRNEKTMLIIVFFYYSLSLVACESTDIPKYEEMSEFELVMHNSLLPENEQIVCQEKRREWIGGTFHRIPRRCFTIGQLKRIQRDSKYASIRGVTSIKGDGSASGAAGF